MMANGLIFQSRSRFAARLFHRGINKLFLLKRLRLDGLPNSSFVRTETFSTFTSSTEKFAHTTCTGPVPIATITIILSPILIWRHVCNAVRITL